MPIMAMKAISKMTVAIEDDDADRVVDLDISSCVSTNLFSSSFIIDDVSEKIINLVKHMLSRVIEPSYDFYLPFFVVK